MNETVLVHGRGNFPTLELRLRDLVTLVRTKLEADGVVVRDMRLNGGAASHVLAQVLPPFFVPSLASSLPPISSLRRFFRPALLFCNFFLERGQRRMNLWSSSCFQSAGTDHSTVICSAGTALSSSSCQFSRRAKRRLLCQCFRSPLNLFVCTIVFVAFN